MQMSFTGERYVPQLRGQIYYEHLHRYALALSLAHNKDILDVASGEGYGSALLAIVARSVVGVDIDEASVNFAASRYASMNLAFKTGSATQIPLADASVDLVVSFETIEHLVEQERMLGEMKRVLRPTGQIIISSPNKLIYSDARAYSNPFHVRELYFHEFRDLLCAFFPEVRIFGQRVFAASAVHPLGGAGLTARWLGPSATSENGMTALADPEYFVALCGCEKGTELPNLASVYVDHRDDLLADIRLDERTVGAQRMTAGASPTALETSQNPTVSSAPTSPSVDALTAENGQLRHEEFEPSEPDAAAQIILALRSENEQLRRELAETAEQMPALTFRAVEAERLNEELKHSEADTAAQILTLSSRVVLAERLLEPLQQELTALREGAAKLRSELRREQGNTGRLANELDASRAEHDASRAELDTTRAELDTTRAELSRITLLEQRRASELQDAGAQIASIVTSRSWRLTLPLRRVGILARARRNR